jgi:hypothetical protein
VLSLTAFYPRSINRDILDESLSLNDIIEEKTLKASNNQESDKNTQDKFNPEESHKDFNKDAEELEILERDLEKADESLKNADGDGRPCVNKYENLKPKFYVDNF